MGSRSGSGLMLKLSRPQVCEECLGLLPTFVLLLYVTRYATLSVGIARASPRGGRIVVVVIVVVSVVQR